MRKQKSSGMFFVLAIAVVVIVSVSFIIPSAIAKNNAENTFNEDYSTVPSNAEETTPTEPTTESIPPYTMVDYHGNEPTSAKQIVADFARVNGLSMSLWPDELIEHLETHPEAREFVLCYPFKKDLTPEIDLSQYAHTDSVPLFMQWDERWGYASYGDDLLAVSGCGPTCLSMVSVHLLGDTSLDPKTVAEFSEQNGYCVPGNGSAWALISEGGPALGLYVEELPLDENYVVQNLKEGNPVICIMGPGDFTQGGHFIVMTDYIDGQIKINDPNSVINSEKLWNHEDIESQIDNLWACSVW